MRRCQKAADQSRRSGLLLHARVAELPARLREFYDLRYVQGWSERELVARLGLCRASVRWLDYTCRRAI